MSPARAPPPSRKRAVGAGGVAGGDPGFGGEAGGRGPGVWGEARGAGEGAWGEVAGAHLRGARDWEDEAEGVLGCRRAQEVGEAGQDSCGAPRGLWGATQLGRGSGRRGKGDGGCWVEDCRPSGVSFAVVCPREAPPSAPCRAGA